MSVATFQVTGMTCGHCEASIREEVSEVPGVVDVAVSAATFGAHRSAASGS